MTLTTDDVVGTLREILGGEDPVLQVEHWATDGWFFQAVRSYYVHDCIDVPFGDLLRIDPTLAELADLPDDWVATREQPGAEWDRHWIFESTRYLWEGEVEDP